MELPLTEVERTVGRADLGGNLGVQGWTYWFEIDIGHPSRAVREQLDGGTGLRGRAWAGFVHLEVSSRHLFSKLTSDDITA